MAGDGITSIDVESMDAQTEVWKGKRLIKTIEEFSLSVHRCSKDSIE